MEGKYSEKCRMENREQQILSEIKAMMSSIRSQLELLDAKMAELQQVVEPQGVEVVPIDLDIDIADYEPAAEPAAGEPVNEEPVDDDLPMAENEPVAEEPSVLEEADEPESEDVVADEPVDDDLPMFAEPEPELVAAPVIDLMDEPEPKQAVIDAMTAKQAWRIDMPGTPVKDIRSAISLNDRIFFINYLFNEDPMAFQDTLTRINQMGALDEVVDLVVTEHPDWNLDSDVVYRFMMAVRRRIR